MINRVDNRSMMQCLLKCNELLKQVNAPGDGHWLHLPRPPVHALHACSRASCSVLLYMFLEL